MRIELTRFNCSQAPKLAALLESQLRALLLASRDGEQIVIYSEETASLPVSNDEVPTEDWHPSAGAPARAPDVSAQPDSQGAEPEPQQAPATLGEEDAAPAIDGNVPITRQNPVAPPPADQPKPAEIDPPGLAIPVPAHPVGVIDEGAPALNPPMVQPPAPEPAQVPEPMLNQEEFTLVGVPEPPRQSTTQRLRVWFTDASTSGCAHGYVQGRGRQVLSVQGRHLERFCLAIRLLQLDLPVSTTRYVGRARYESCTLDADVAFNAILEMCGRVLACASPEIAGIDLDLGLDAGEAPGEAEVAPASAATMS